MTPVIAAALRAAGFDVRVVQPNDGAGTFAGDVGDVGLRVAKWAHDGWQADLWCEIHGQALGDTTTRGQFVIYPDWPSAGDLDTSVRDVFGPLLTKEIAEHTNIPRAGNGLLSERKTQVGLDGFRLGIFSTTKGLAPKTLRCIAEVATYTNPVDVQVLAAPDYPQKLAAAFVEGIKAYYMVPA